MGLQDQKLRFLEGKVKTMDLMSALHDWLHNRALRVNTKTRKKLATAFHVPEAMIVMVNDYVADTAEQYLLGKIKWATKVFVDLAAKELKVDPKLVQTILHTLGVPTEG